MKCGRLGVQSGNDVLTGSMSSEAHPLASAWGLKSLQSSSAELFERWLATICDFSSNDLLWCLWVRAHTCAYTYTRVHIHI